MSATESTNLRVPAKGSLRRKLPAMIGVLLIASVGVFGTIAYQTAREAALRSTYARLEAVAEHVADLVDEGMEMRNQRLQSVAARPVFAAYVVTRDSASAAAALDELSVRGVRGRSTFEIRDAQGRAILTSDSLQNGESSPEAPPSIAYDTASTGPIRLRGNEVVIENGTPIIHNGAKIGSLVEVRAFALTDNMATRITQLIGAHAGILIGNADGSLWIDLAGKVHPMPATMEGSIYQRENEQKIGRAVPIRNSRLAAAVDLRSSDVLGPIEKMVEPLLVIALLIILGGTLTGWALIRTITEPLAHLTAASEAMSAREFRPASGNSPVVASERDDEIGVLSRAFAGMAARVQESRERLEQQVDERTTALRETLTKLQNAQQELVVKERLATLGQLSSSVGHELRNPLGVMTNAAYLLESSLETSPEKSRHYLQTIRSQIGMSEKIVSDLLDFARIRSPQRSVVTIDAVIDEQLGRVRIPESIRVVRDIPAGLPVVNIDKVQIGQVLFNLITNAVQAMEGGNGSAERVLSLRAQQTGGFVRVDVVDSGPGIAPEHIAKVFEPLFTTRARGIGLGLSVSRSLAQVNGGGLNAASEYGNGATFTLTVPVAAP